MTACSASFLLTILYQIKSPNPFRKSYCGWTAQYFSLGRTTGLCVEGNGFCKNHILNDDGYPCVGLVFYTSRPSMEQCPIPRLIIGNLLVPCWEIWECLPYLVERLVLGSDPVATLALARPCHLRCDVIRPMSRPIRIVNLGTFVTATSTQGYDTTTGTCELSRFVIQVEAYLGNGKHQGVRWWLWQPKSWTLLVSLVW